MYKLISKIKLVCSDRTQTENCYQAWLVDPSNKKQLQSALSWAEWKEYGPRVQDENGKWTYESIITHDPVVFDFNNDGFTFELLDCAGGSSQGGRLSFWNCLVHKDDKTFKIGINSELLLSLLKEGNFNKGVCAETVSFVSDNGKIGVCITGGELYKNAQVDMDKKASIAKALTAAYNPGDNVVTATIDEIYLGPIYQYYVFDCGEYNRGKWPQDYVTRYCTITKLKQPIVWHMYTTRTDRDKSLSVWLADNNFSEWWYDLRENKTKRAVGSNLMTIDCPISKIGESIQNTYSNIKNYSEKYMSEGYCKNYSDRRKILSMVRSKSFGLSFEPFGLDELTLNKIRECGIKYIEE